MTHERRLSLRHHAGLYFTFRAPCDNRTYNATGDHNLVGFNGDPGPPLTHVWSPFQALPATQGMVDSDGGS